MNGRWQQLVQLPRRVLSVFVHGPARIEQVADDTRRATKINAETAAIVRDIDERTVRLEKIVAKDLRTLVDDLRKLREEVRDRLLQYNLQLGRLSRLAVDEDEAPRLSGRSISVDAEEAEPPAWESVAPHPDPEGREWLTLDACPMCGHGERTIVNEWNKLILLRKAPDATSARYDFAMCHACGVAYATRRPFGERYRFLLAHFEDVTGKHGDDRAFTNPLLNPYPLTEADRDTLKRRAAAGVYVSEHLGFRSNDYLEGLLLDRFENSVHLDLIGALVPPRNARVLEIRPRTGMISEGLRRLFGAAVYTMPIWESQQFLLKEVYGIESSGLVDYDQFDIAGDGAFDLIVCNHMLTHSVRPQRFFDVVRRRLAPGGHLYFYNEPDDAEYLTGNQSMLATLNPLHMQSFDRKSLARALGANGFEVIFHKRRDENHICLAKMTGASWTPMTEQDRKRRVRSYRRARDRAILGLQGDLRARFAGEWEQVVARGVADGVVEFDAEGQLRLIAR
jgi:SAM-dependent methyltransferase